MLTLPPQLAKLCQGHRISTDLPADEFIAKCVEAILTECVNTLEVQKSVGLAVAAQSRYCPNPGIERSEKVAAFDVSELPTQQTGDDPNRCLDSAFPFLAE